MYAILNENDICVMISSTPGLYEKVIETNLDVINKKYVEGEWLDVGIPNEEPDPVLNKLSDIESLLNDSTNSLVIMDALATIYEMLVAQSGGAE